MSDAKISAIPGWAASARFDQSEQLGLSYTDALVYDGGRVADEVFAALQEALSDEQLLELTYAIAMYDMHAVIARALQLEYDDCAEPITEVAGPKGGTTIDIGTATTDRETK